MSTQPKATRPRPTGADAEKTLKEAISVLKERFRQVQETSRKLRQRLKEQRL